MEKPVNPSRIIIKLSGRTGWQRAKPSSWADSILFNHRKTLSQLFPGIKLSNLFFSVTPKKILGLVRRAMSNDKHYCPPDFFGYYAIDHPGDGKALLKILCDNPQIESAYLETGALHPPFESRKNLPGFVYQHWLEPAPRGVDAKHAWTFRGGDGRGRVKFVDVEQGWILDHEAYQVKQFPSTGLNAHFFRNHGAAVLGVLLMHTDDDAPKGIVRQANGAVVSQWRPDGRFNTADAIMAAIAQLNRGDVLLLEAQIPDHPGSDKLWPIEIHEAIFQVIRLATALGITVIEAAGNGGVRTSLGNNIGKFKDHLGRSVLMSRDNSFRDSGAILVAASTASVPHEKTPCSNYGDRVDCYAQGELVFTAGSLLGSSGGSTDSYTRGFAGTSAAAAIIAGVAIATQSIAEANYHFRLSPGQLRRLFRSDSLTTPSARGRLVDKIGGMPDLKRIIEYLEQFSTQLFAEASLLRLPKI